MLVSSRPGGQTRDEQNDLINTVLDLFVAKFLSDASEFLEHSDEASSTDADARSFEPEITMVRHYHALLAAMQGVSVPQDCEHITEDQANHIRAAVRALFDKAVSTGMYLKADEAGEAQPAGIPVL